MYVFNRGSGLVAVFLFALTALMFLAIPAHTQTVITVINTDDDGPGSLRQAIADAEDGDTIVFDPDILPATIVLDTEIDITNSITIDGPGADLLTLDANNDSRIFSAVVGERVIEVVLRGMRFINGSSDFGGAITNTEKLSIDGCTFEDNFAGFDGGAIIGSDLFITNTTFNNNSAGNEGGAITSSRSANIINSTFNNNSSGSNGGAISFRIDEETLFLNISFTTIANNTAGNSGGGIRIGGPTNIINSIVAFNEADTGNNCTITADGEINDRGGNYSNDNSCGFTGDNAFIELGDLADNGGTTETIALLGGDPFNGSTQSCDSLDSEGDPTSIRIGTDQRGFSRPTTGPCDSGAFQSISSRVSITKLNNSPELGEAVFTSTGFEDLDCDITDFFTLDNSETAKCIVTDGDYTITEQIPEGQVLNIICTELPEAFFINNFTGLLDFTISETVESVNCFFINSLAQMLIETSLEPPGENCEFGGTKIETGFDTTGDGNIDETENVFYACDGAPGGTGPTGETGPEGPPGDTAPGMLIELISEPPGSNCEFGGIRIVTGFDTTGDGRIDQVEDTAFVCNGAPGFSGDDPLFANVSGESNCSLAGTSIHSVNITANLLLFSMIFGAVLLRKRMRECMTG